MASSSFANNLYVNYTITEDRVPVDMQAGPYSPFSVGREIREIKGKGGFKIKIVRGRDDSRKHIYQTMQGQCFDDFCY